MRAEVTRWVDKNVGRPFCFFLTLHRRFCEFFKKDTVGYEKTSKILFIKLIEQGSTVLAYPALKKATDMVGNKNVYFLVFKENCPILDILNVIPPSCVIDMEFFSRASAILAYLSSADKRVGLHPFNCEGLYRGDLFTHKLVYNPYLHTKSLFMILVEALNHNPPPKDDQG